MKKISIVLFIAMVALTSRADVSQDVTLTCVVEYTAPSYITISSTNMTWVQYITTNEVWRFNSSKLTCEFFASFSPWEISVYHTNPIGAAYGALKGSKDYGPDFGGIGDHYLPMRLWQPNYGPTNFYELGYLPDPMDQNVWTNSPLVFSTHATYQSKLASQATEDTSPVEFNFMVDAHDAAETNYSGTVYFELKMP